MFEKLPTVFITVEMLKMDSKSASCGTTTCKGINQDVKNSSWEAISTCIDNNAYNFFIQCIPIRYIVVLKEGVLNRCF